MPVPPVFSRQLAGGSPSARGLLLTVLGELVLPCGGHAWTASLIDVLARFGIEEKATRQAVMRTAAAGWLAAERQGRRTRWALTADAATLLRDGAERIYGFRGSQQEWEGRWLVVHARIPDVDRRARHHVQSRLSWAGLGVLAPGLWVSPRADRLGEVRRVLEDAGLTDAYCFLARHEYGDPQAMIHTAWDVPAIASAYREFLAGVEASDGADPLAAQVGLVHRWRRFPQIDPALPRELLPQPWPGDTAAIRFRERHDELRLAAQQAWRTLDAT